MLWIISILVLQATEFETCMDGGITASLFVFGCGGGGVAAVEIGARAVAIDAREPDVPLFGGTMAAGAEPEGLVPPEDVLPSPG
jgi:hypothetical protein